MGGNREFDLSQKLGVGTLNAANIPTLASVTLGYCFPFNFWGVANYLSVARSLWNRGSNTMNEPHSKVVLYEDQGLIDDLADDLPDVALEIAGRKLCEGPASAATISFCSGYDTCPWEKRL